MPQVDSEGRLVLAHLTVRVLQPDQFTDGRYLAAGKAKSRCLKILGTLRASQPSGLRSESEIRGSFFSPYEPFTVEPEEVKRAVNFKRVGRLACLLQLLHFKEGRVANRLDFWTRLLHGSGRAYHSPRLCGNHMAAPWPAFRACRIEADLQFLSDERANNPMRSVRFPYRW